MPKRAKPEIQLLNNEKQGELWRYIAKNQSHTTFGIALFMATSIRIRELYALQWKEIDMKKWSLTIRKTI